MFHRGVETFLAVARLKTLKGAATKLHLAQSTVSKRIQQLEEECGNVLFERSKGGKEAVLTPAGEQFVGVAERMLDLFHEARLFSVTQDKYLLSVGAVTSMNAAFMPNLYMRLLDREPLLKVTVDTLHSVEMYDAIDSRHIDVGFSLLERAHPSVNVAWCFSEPMLGVRLARPGDTRGDIVPLGSLDPEREIYFPWSPPYQVWHFECFSAGAARISMDDPHLLFTLLQHPEQWAIVPASIARFFQASRGLHLFRLDPAPPDRVCYKLTHKYPRARSREVLAILDRHLGDVLEAEFGPARGGVVPL